MVGEVFGSANMDVGIWDFNIGISNQLFLVYFYNLPTPNFPLLLPTPAAAAARETSAAKSATESTASARETSAWRAAKSAATSA